MAAMSHDSGELIESQVDWLTASAHGKERSQRLMDVARHVAKEEAAQGNQKRRWRLMGYEGHRIGRIAYGRRDDASALVQLSGDAAERRLTDVLSEADVVTRLDLAATWRATPPDPLFGRNQYVLAEMFYRSHPRSARPWFVGDASGGFTCYLGSRESATFLRIYDKGAESLASDDREGLERYRACWRVELEAKASMASALATMVADREDRADYVRGYLVSFMEAHGMQAPFLAGGRVSLLPGFRRRSDETSKLQHLARNVKPTVRWLESRGRGADLRIALGIDHMEDSLRELQRILRGYGGKLDVPPESGR